MESELRGEYRALVSSRPELFENPRGRVSRNFSAKMISGRQRNVSPSSWAHSGRQQSGRRSA
jgi:hypothetical protein